MFANISTQTQRGSYPYVQIFINATGAELTLESRGMSQSTLSTLLNKRGASSLDCQTNANYVKEGLNFWTNKKIKEITSKNVAINFLGEGAVCFSKDGTHYKTLGNIAGDVSIILCSRSAYSSNICPTTKADGLIKPAYKVVWSRFANIEKHRWSGDAWTRQ